MGAGGPLGDERISTTRGRVPDIPRDAGFKWGSGGGRGALGGPLPGPEDLFASQDNGNHHPLGGVEYMGTPGEVTFQGPEVSVEGGSLTGQEVSLVIAKLVLLCDNRGKTGVVVFHVCLDFLQAEVAARK